MSTKGERTFRLRAESDADVVTQFEIAVVRLSTQLRHRGRKLKTGPFLHALAKWFAQLPAHEQDRIGAEALGLINATGPDSVSAKPDRATLHGRDVTPPSQRRKRG